MNRVHKILFLVLILMVVFSGMSCAPSKSGRNAIQPVHYRPSWGHYHHHYRPPPYYGPHRRY